MTYDSIVPSEMTQRELKSICADIQIAKNWNLTHAVVRLSNGIDYKVDVKSHVKYQRKVKIKTGSIARNVGL